MFGVSTVIARIARFVRYEVFSYRVGFVDRLSGGLPYCELLQGCLACFFRSSPGGLIRRMGCVKYPITLKGFFHMKKLLLALGGISASAASFAAEGSGAINYEGSVAATIANDASTTLQNFLTGVGPVVAGIVVAGLAIWAGIAIVGIVKKAFSAGKGR